MAKLKPSDLAAMNRAEDLTGIAHYRVGVRSGPKLSKRSAVVMTESIRFLSMGEINPFIDDLLDEDIARFNTPEEAEAAAAQYIAANKVIGLETDTVVAGVNAAGMILAIDGQTIKDEEDDEESEIPI